MQQVTNAGKSWRRGIRIVSLAVILFSPFLGEVVDEIDWRWRSRHASLALGDLAAYRERRPPQIDELLPDGARGTGFVPELPDVAGVAFPRRSSMLVAIKGRDASEVAAIEIHERAHLLHASFERTVNRILATAGAPSLDTYAAKNDGEHFAEMAAMAWELLRPPDGMCWAIPASERLEDAEQLVPGTAGFVAYFLSRSGVTSEADTAELLRAAETLTSSSRAVWASLWEQLDARRAADGTLAPWPRLSRLEAFERAMARGREEGGVLGRLEVLRYWPSTVLLRLVSQER